MDSLLSTALLLGMIASLASLPVCLVMFVMNVVLERRYALSEKAIFLAEIITLPMLSIFVAELIRTMII